MSEIKAVFSINAGRSGSQYLSRMLGSGKNCVAFHELNPSGFGQALVDYHRGDDRKMRDVARVKYAFMETFFRKNLIYAETNHSFVKGFGWPLIEMMDQRSVAVITLRRDPEKIIESMIRVRSLPLSSTGKFYNLTPERLNPIVLPPTLFGLTPAASYSVGKLVAVPEKILARVKKLIFGYPIKRYVPLRRYQENIIRWYLRETVELEKLFKKRFPECVYIDLDIDDLNDSEKIVDLFGRLGIEWEEGDITGVGIPANTKDRQKRKFLD